MKNLKSPIFCALFLMAVTASVSANPVSETGLIVVGEGTETKNINQPVTVNDIINAQ